MKNLSTLIKLSTLLIIGCGTVSAAVGVTEAQMKNNDIVENDEFVHAADVQRQDNEEIYLKGHFKGLGSESIADWDQRYYFKKVKSGSETYFETVVHFNAGDIFGCELSKDPNNSKYISYTGVVKDNSTCFELDGTVNTKVKLEGSYYFRVDGGKTKWLKAERIENPVVFKWKYENDKISKSQLGFKSFDENKSLYLGKKQESFVPVNGLYSFDITSLVYYGYDKVEIATVKDDGEWNWNYKTGMLNLETVKLRMQNSDLIYTIKENDKNGTKDGYFKCFEVANPTNINNNFVRVWADGNHLGAKDSSKIRDSWFIAHVWDNKGNSYDYPGIKHKMNNNGRELYYFDLPKSKFNDGYKVMLKGYDWQYGNFNMNTIEYDVRSINNNKIQYIWQDNDTFKISGNHFGADGRVKSESDYENQVQASSMVKVFEQYYTCDPSSLNGYGAIREFVNTWIGGWKENGEINWWLLNGELNKTYVKDFENSKVEDYAAGINKTKDINLYQKLLNMIAKSKSEPLPAGSQLSNNLFSKENMPFTITTVVLLGLSTIGIFGFIFLNKKRKPLFK